MEKGFTGSKVTAIAKKKLKEQERRKKIKGIIKKLIFSHQNPQPGSIVEKLNTASLNSQNFKALIESGMSPEDVRKSFERDRDNQSRIRTEYKRLKSIKKKDEKKLKEFKKY